MKYQLGDIIISGSKKSVFNPMGWIGWGIRLFTTSPGESLSRATHIAMVFDGADKLYGCKVIEAVAKGVKIQTYGKPYKCIVYRPIDLTATEHHCICAEALRLRGTHYGYIRILAHALDWITTGGKLNRYRFRKRMKGGKLAGRECSNVIAYLWSKCRGLDFGVPAYAASPDDIDDYCLEKEKKYRIIRFWSRYKGKKED